METKRMIGIDCLFADPARTFGTWVFAKNLLDEVTRADTETDYVVFLPPRAARDLKLTRHNLRLHVSRWAGTSAVVRLLYQNIILPLYALSEGLSLLHSLGNYGAVFSLVPTVVTVHDMLAHFDSENTNNLHLRIRAPVLDFLMRSSLKRARVISVDSQFTRRQLEARFPFSSGKVRVIHAALPAGRSTMTPDHELVLRRYGVVKPYVLAVGLFPPHKNIGRLIVAFAMLKRHGSLPHKLVLVGKPQRSLRELNQLATSEGVSGHVIFTGRVEDDELPCFYAGADLFVYPSLMEGFGLPLLEAMANRVPVVCSSAGPLLEVAGDAAVLFDPSNVEDMARAIREVLQSPVLRERLTVAGLKRVQRFSFRRAAEETLNLYREVLETNRKPGGNDRG